MSDGSMKPTLDDLRAKFETAKKWAPWEDIHCGRGEFPECWERLSDDWNKHPWCDPCSGAKRAAEDAIKLGNSAIVAAVDYERLSGPDAERWKNGNAFLSKGERDTGNNGIFATARAEDAARIESYFGGPGPWSEFAAAVREFCK